MHDCLVTFSDIRKGWQGGDVLSLCSCLRAPAAAAYSNECAVHIHTKSQQATAWLARQHFVGSARQLGSQSRAAAVLSLLLEEAEHGDMAHWKGDLSQACSCASATVDLQPVVVCCGCLLTRL